MATDFTDDAEQYAQRKEVAEVMGIHPDTLTRFRKEGRYTGKIRMARFGKAQEVKFNLIDVFALVYPEASPDKRAELMYQHRSEIRSEKRNGNGNGAETGGRRKNAESVEKKAENGHAKDARDVGSAKLRHLRIQPSSSERIAEVRRKIGDLSAANQRRKAGLPEGDVPPGSSRSGQLLDLSLGDVWKR